MKARIRQASLDAEFDSCQIILIILKSWRDAAMADALLMDGALRAVLETVSYEVTAKDTKSIEAAAQLPAGTEVFIASLPKQSVHDAVPACQRLRQLGMRPVPHIAARNIRDRRDLRVLLEGMSRLGGVDRALVIAGDRAVPIGEFSDSLELIQSGVLESCGIERIYISCYPEGHPQISDAVLEESRQAKLEAAKTFFSNVGLVSQFCFDAKPITRLARRVRDLHPGVSYRIGVAGPASRMTLLKYAMACGIGASLRGLRERQNLASGLLGGETPEGLMREIADAQAADRTLPIGGFHFFTFGSLKKSVDFLQGLASD